MDQRLAQPVSGGRCTTGPALAALGRREDALTAIDEPGPDASAFLVSRGLGLVELTGPRSNPADLFEKLLG